METNSKRTVTITKTVTKKQTGQITINVPNEIATEDICDWLYENEELWLENVTDNAHLSEIHYDPEFDDTRYDVNQTQIVYGGHL